MKNKKGPNKSCTPQELEVILRAKRERKIISFESGFPKIVEKPCAAHIEKSSLPLLLSSADEPKAGSILSPISDLLNLFASLEGYLSYYVSELSKTDLRREDCLHMYEPDKSGTAVQHSEALLKTITEKLSQITAERRHIKNRYEVIKFIHHAFMNEDGKMARAFLSKLLHDVIHLEKSQKERIYTPKTDAISDILATAQLIQNVPMSNATAIVADTTHTGSSTGNRSRSTKKRRIPYVND